MIARFPPSVIRRSLSSRSLRAKGSPLALILLEDRSASPKLVRLCGSINRKLSGLDILDFPGDVPSSRRSACPAGARPGGGPVRHDEDLRGEPFQMRMPGSVTEAASIDRLIEDPRITIKGRHLVLVDDHRHCYYYDYWSHLQRQTQQKGCVALAGVPSVVTSKTGLHRSLVRGCADRSEMGDHRRPLRSQLLTSCFVYSNGCLLQ